jgi:FtsZ-binding cell division protein ZapB
MSQENSVDQAYFMELVELVELVELLEDENEKLQETNQDLLERDQSLRKENRELEESDKSLRKTNRALEEKVRIVEKRNGEQTMDDKIRETLTDRVSDLQRQIQSRDAANEKLTTENRFLESSREECDNNLIDWM